MHANRDQQDSSLRRRGTIAVSLGAVAGGMLVAALAQVATAPAAGADVIINGFEDTFAEGNVAFGDASTAFANGDVADGLGYGFAGLDDYLFAPIGDLAENTYEELVGGPGYFFDYNPEVDAPTTLAATATDITQLLGTVETDFTTAASDLGSSDLFDAAGYAFAGIGSLIEVPEVGFIGITDTLLGGL
jgi:hypothetical protein